MKKGLNMTTEQARAHQEKHGFGLEQFVDKGQAAQKAVEMIIDKKLHPYQAAMLGLARKSQQMPRTEAEFGRILEAQKRRGEIGEYRHQGIRLAWGVDPDTGKPMWYTPDYYVERTRASVRQLYPDPPGKNDLTSRCFVEIVLIEIKSGARASKTYKDRVRFRGCRACWPMFQFELWEKKAGQWKRLE